MPAVNAARYTREVKEETRKEQDILNAQVQWAQNLPWSTSRYLIKYDQWVPAGLKTITEAQALAAADLATSVTKVQCYLDMFNNSGFTDANGDIALDNCFQIDELRKLLKRASDELWTTRYALAARKKLKAIAKQRPDLV